MRDQVFNEIKPIVPIRQEWVVKQVIEPIVTSSDDEDDMQGDSLILRDGTPPHDNMDINMVFVLPSKFKAINEEVAQLNLGPKEAIFEKSKESSQHLRPLYVKGHIDGRQISNASGWWSHRESNAIFSFQEARNRRQRAHKDKFVA